MNNATVCSRKCSFFVLQMVRSTIEILQKTEKTLPRSNVRILISWGWAIVNGMFYKPGVYKRLAKKNFLTSVSSIYLL